MKKDYSEEIEKYTNKFQPRIKSLASKFSNTICSKEDLLQEGILSVIECFNMYGDNAPEKISYYILHKMHKASFENRFAVHVPSGSFNIVKNNTSLHISSDFDENNYDNFIDNGSIEYYDLVDVIDKYDHDNIARMCFIEGLSCKEIAEKTKMSTVYVYKKLAAIREVIMEKLKNVMSNV